MRGKKIEVSTDGGVCPEVLNGDEPAPALVVLEQLEVEPDAQGEVGHLNHPLVQQLGAADGVGIGVSQADLSESNWPSQTNAYRLIKNLTLLSKTRMESASMARRPQKIARRGKCPLMMAFRFGRLSLPNLSEERNSPLSHFYPELPKKNKKGILSLICGVCFKVQT